MKRFLAMLLSALLPALASAATVRVGSKTFTESYVLAEIAARALEQNPGVTVERKSGLGSTGILFEALRTGGIDLYPDYAGTLAETLLHQPGLRTLPELRAGLAKEGLTISEPLGFENTYALAVREDYAAEQGLRTLSDLARVAPRLNAAFSYEFMERADGFRGLRDVYDFRFRGVARMEHGLVYRALDSHAADVAEVYSTDANIDKFHLRRLADDRRYFPGYAAVWVARLDFVRSHPELWAALQRATAGRLDEGAMRRMNLAADTGAMSFADIAADFLGERRSRAPGWLREVGRRTGEHLWLVGWTLLFSILVGIPGGIVAARYPRAGQAILLGSALVQTIPSLALLAFLIPLAGIGAGPALIALCLYGLLPVVLNTYTGLRGVEARHLENARAFGLTPRQILLRIELPLASPTILAGVKTAAIVSVGTATLAALVGAGGYGAPILTGLSLNNISIILTGAVPSAALALAAHLAFGLLARVVIPRGLRGGS